VVIVILSILSFSSALGQGKCKARSLALQQTRFISK